tara:strand:+ start:21032 stop:21304 length:273 start_codon:yes stop_codon:yes gene_type:complete
MKRILLLLTLFFYSCNPIAKIKKESNPGIAPISFSDLDIDNNGTIDKLEYYKSMSEVDSKKPAYGLLLILGGVAICAFAPSLFYRNKKDV